MSEHKKLEHALGYALSGTNRNVDEITKLVSQMTDNPDTYFEDKLRNPNGTPRSPNYTIFHRICRKFPHLTHYGFKQGHIDAVLKLITILLDKGADPYYGCDHISKSGLYYIFCPGNEAKFSQVAELLCKRGYGPYARIGEKNWFLFESMRRGNYPVCKVLIMGLIRPLCIILEAKVKP